MDYSKSFSLYLYILADMATKLAKNSPLAMCLLCFFDQQTNILSLFCVFSRFFWCFLVLLTSSFFLPHLSFICLRLFFSHCRVIWWVSVIPAVVGSRSHCPAAFPCSCLVCLFHPCFLVPVVFSWSCLCPLINYIHWYFCVSSCTFASTFSTLIMRDALELKVGLGAIQMSQYPTNRWVTAYDWQKWEVTTTSVV